MTQSTPATEAITKHRAITLLTDGHSNPFVAKTAISILRYRGDDVVAVLDAHTDAKTAEEVFKTGGSTPFVASLNDIVGTDALYIGIAPPGGNLPPEWKPLILSAIEQKMDIVSGLHDFLNEDPDYVAAAQKSGAKLIDVRANRFKKIASGQPFNPNCVRIHSVGQDCSVGKMVATLEINRGLIERGYDAEFLATGQTGIMISGKGIPIDCVVSDFVNGAAEHLVRSNENHDFVFVEGQGSISHPAYSAVTLGLLHGCAPDGLVFCYEAGRDQVKGLTNIDLPDMRQQMDACLVNARLRHPCEMIGVVVNTRTLNPQQATDEIKRAEDTYNLPACDVYRDGPDKLVEACIELKQKLGGKVNVASH